MGYQSLVYGRIQGAQNAPGDPNGCVHRHNEAVLLAVPDQDAEWPFLTRHMFSVAHCTAGEPRGRGLYKSQIIHFGASLKDFLTDGIDWSVWIGTFEAILKQLLWWSAKLHIESPFESERLYIYGADTESCRRRIDDVQRLGRPADGSQHDWTREIIRLETIETDWLL